MRAIQITEFGGPEVLQQVELPDPVAGEGEVLINVSRAGLNYADTGMIGMPISSSVSRNGTMMLVSANPGHNAFTRTSE